MKSMAILLSPKGQSQGYESGPEEEDGEDIANSVEFSEMFDAFADAAGLKPTDVESARKRFVALLNIWCHGKDY